MTYLYRQTDEFICIIYNQHFILYELLVCPFSSCFTLLLHYMYTYARDDIIKDYYQHDQYGHAVEEAIADERPPVQLANGARAEGTYRNDKHDVEHRRANDTADADVVLGEEHANDNGGQLWS